MARQQDSRYKTTDYRKAVFEFTPEDLAPYIQQSAAARQAEDGGPGFGSKLLNSVGAFAEGLQFLPGGLTQFNRNIEGEVPLAGSPLKMTNAYLIRNREGRHLLIDNGFNQPEALRSLLESLKSLDVHLEEMDFFIVLTLGGVKPPAFSWQL
jgi:hypothetical protein